MSIHAKEWTPTRHTHVNVIALDCTNHSCRKVTLALGRKKHPCARSDLHNREHDWRVRV